jgi:hypothetical protein
MKMVEMNWRPSDRQLRQFGLIAMFAMPLLGWLWRLDLTVVAGLAMIGAGMALISLVYAPILRGPYVALCLVTLPIGIVVGELMLLVGFYGVFLPIGMIVRWLGRDDLQRSFEPQANTYWQPKAPPNGPGSYLRQF